MRAWLLLLCILTAQAQDYPSRPIRLILPQQPGSATDVLARLVAVKLGDTLGQPLVIENRIGAGGLLGAEAAAKAPPDGYTLLVGATAWITVAPHTYKTMPYDPLADFLPVSLFAVSQNLLAVNPSLPATSVKELVALMKAKPGELNMASAGVASSSHLAGLLLTSLADVRATHVPYKGAGASVLAVVSGEAQWTFTPMQGPLPHVRSGKLRALAVGGATRSPALPDVPTVAESGIPEYFSGTWYGLMAPKGTPPAIVERLNAATVKTMAVPEMREQIANQGADARTTTPPEFARFVRDEYERMAKVVKLAGLVPE
ncbi:MAG TPA: tripartite tricarboxylate transporter substrate binding protein [Burkholderiales bacterium]|nr:tripartite tricarboxylate transporter substrate binding protein [Burkholderiales bacterium]